MLTEEEKKMLDSISPGQVAVAYEGLLDILQGMKSTILEGETSEEDARKILTAKLVGIGLGWTLVREKVAYRIASNGELARLADSRPNGIYAEEAGGPNASQILSLSRGNELHQADGDGVASPSA